MAKVRVPITGALTMLSQATPPSPTLSNRDMILTNSHLRTSPNARTTSPILYRSDPTASHSSTFSTNSLLAQPNWQSEVGIATAIRMPFRVKPGPPLSVLAHNTYDGGSPLGDIREDEVLTPNSRGKRKSRSLSPIEQDFYTPNPPFRHKGSVSDQSISSNDSDLGDWENFDSSKMMNGRLAADLAKVNDEMDVEGFTSKRNSIVSTNTEDEMAVLNEKAEKILENARKRLTHMEDNLSKARHTMLVSQRSSPNLAETHHPAGGLYRSISLAGTSNVRKSRSLYPVVKANAGIHSRGSSDVTGGHAASGSGLRKLSMSADSRSSSAQDYSRRAESPQYTRASPVTRYFTHSPTSSRSLNSPLRIPEEENASISTNKTSPDYNAPRGLGINTLGTSSKEDLSVYPGQSSISQVRSPSASSVRSTRDLKEQMSELRTRISDLKSRTEADEVRRRELQSRDTPSPFTNAKINEQGQKSASQDKDDINTPSTSTERPRPISPQITKSSLSHQTPTTPNIHVISKNLEPPTTGQSKGESMIRTDMNTPSLGKRLKDVTPNIRSDSEQKVSASQYKDRGNVFKDDDDGEVVASEEEQIYLNEVLEESLHDIAPEVPGISEHIIAAENGESERHEDRIDAFDYENMFLHSAMGNYRGDDERSEGTSEHSEVTDGSSVATKRANQHTPSVDDDEDTGMAVDGDNDNDEHQDEEQQKQPEDMSPAIQVEAVESPQASEPNSPATPKAYLAPRKPWVHSRSDSMDSISTAATFATAHSGNREDERSPGEAPAEVLSWGNGTAFPQPPSGSPKKDVGTVWPTPPMSAHTPQDDQSPKMNGFAHEPFVRPIIGANHSFGSNGAFGMPTPPVQSPTISEISPTTRAPNTYTIQYQPNHSSSPSSPYSRPRPYNQTYAQQPPPQPQFISTGSPAPSLAKYTQDRPANTEILMESLIKLADPDFQVDHVGQPGNVFAEVDKELVLGLLRSVGGVCNGILQGLAKDEARAVKVLRRRLDAARRVLDGEGDNEINEQGWSEPHIAGINDNSEHKNSLAAK